LSCIQKIIEIYCGIAKGTTDYLWGSTYVGCNVWFVSVDTEQKR